MYNDDNKNWRTQTVVSTKTINGNKLTSNCNDVKKKTTTEANAKYAWYQSHPQRMYTQIEKNNAFVMGISKLCIFELFFLMEIDSNGNNV